MKKLFAALIFLACSTTFAADLVCKVNGVETVRSPIVTQGPYLEGEVEVNTTFENEDYKLWVHVLIQNLNCSYTILKITGSGDSIWTYPYVACNLELFLNPMPVSCEIVD